MTSDKLYALGGVTVGLLFTAFFVAIGLGAMRFSPDAALFPEIIAVAGTVFGVINLVHAVAGWQAPPAPASEAPGPVEAPASVSSRALVLALVGPVVYGIVLHLLGFWVASLLVLIGMPWLLSFGRPRVVLALAVATVCSVYVVFVTVFAMHVPAGLFYDTVGTWLQSK